MKVLHVIPSVARVRGGPSQAIFEMTKALKSKGVDVAIATTNDNGPSLLDGVPLNQEISYQDIPTRFFPRLSSPVSSFREYTFSFDLTKWLWSNIENYDAVHVHALFSYPSTAAMTIAEKKKVPYLVRPGGHLCKWALQQGYSKKQKYLKTIGLRNLNQSSGIHFMTAQEEKEARALTISASTFIP
ncbi:MAG: glycosyltransferase [Cyanobacteria bacterium J06555_13]